MRLKVNSFQHIMETKKEEVLMAEEKKPELKQAKKSSFYALMVLRFLYQETDEDHRYSFKKITEELHKTYGETAPGQSVVNRILNDLPEFGFDVRYGDHRKPGYYLATRNLDTDKTALLMKPILASRSLNQTECEEIYQELVARLGPTGKALLAPMEETIAKKPKTTPKTFRNLESLRQAMTKRCQVTLVLPDYFYSPDIPWKERILHASPYHLEEGTYITLLFSAPDLRNHQHLMRIDVSQIDRVLLLENQPIVPIEEVKQGEGSRFVLPVKPGFRNKAKITVSYQPQFQKTLEKQFHEDVVFQGGTAEILTNFDDSLSFFVSNRKECEVLAPVECMNRFEKEKQLWDDLESLNRNVPLQDAKEPRPRFRKFLEEDEELQGLKDQFRKAETALNRQPSKEQKDRYRRLEVRIQKREEMLRLEFLNQSNPTDDPDEYDRIRRKIDGVK